MKNQKHKDRERKRLKKHKRQNIIKHHILNKCRSGKDTFQNLLRFDKHREKAFHAIFGSMTLEEAGRLLSRVSRAKKAQKGE